MQKCVKKIKKKTSLFKDLKSIAVLPKPYIIIMKPFLISFILLGIITLDKPWTDRHYLEMIWKQSKHLLKKDLLVMLENFDI